MIKELIYNYFYKKKYNYVPPCPHCNSSKTGYIICNSDTIKIGLEKEKLSHLLNGEIVEIHSFSNDENELFCSECGLNWFGRPEIKYLTEEEIELEKQRRGIDENFIYNRNLTRQNLRTLKKHKKRQEKLMKKSKKSPKVKTKTQNNHTKTEVKIKK